MKQFLLFVLFCSSVALLPSCGKRCADAEAVNNLEKGDCEYPADRYAGTYTMSCDAVGTNALSPNFTKTFTLTIEKQENSKIQLKDLMGCSAPYSATVVNANPNTFSFGGSATACDSLNFTPIGTGSFDPATKKLTLSFSFAAITGLKYYNCTATGTRQ